MDLFQRYLDVVSLVGEHTWFRKSGFVSCDNDVAEGGVLISGLNPSMPINDLYVPTRSYVAPFKNPGIRYFQKLREIIPDELVDSTAYLDLFPFYEYSQDTLLRHIRLNPTIAAKTLAVTKGEIERLKPKLIIIASSASYPFWGAEKPTWMGYSFEELAGDALPYISSLGLNVKRITGFRKESDIIGEKDQCRLNGSLAVFYRHERAITGTQPRLDAEAVRALYNYKALLF